MAIYDLEERTFQFAKKVRFVTSKLPKTTSNHEDVKQLVRSSASVGANYIEANESLSKKDFLHRMKISRKEAKESSFFLRLLFEANDDVFKRDLEKLYHESVELKKILSAIIVKSQ